MLHAALKNGGTDARVRLILKSAAHRVVRETDDAGNPPLHIALGAGSGVPETIVRAIFTAWPRAACVQNGIGEIPLRIAQRSKVSVGLKSTIEAATLLNLVCESHLQQGYVVTDNAEHTTHTTHMSTLARVLPPNVLEGSDGSPHLPFVGTFATHIMLT